jgi:hypothetical protein
VAGRKAGSIEYKKATRRMGSVITYHQLWKGPDHLLLVKEVGWIEEYKRFYFNDIQAITVRRTATYLVWALVLPVLALFVAGIGLANGAPTSFHVISGVLFLVAWSLHLMQGPTCSCWIQTGINKEKLLMFRRVHQVRKFWKKMEPELTAVQGGFSLESMEQEGIFTERTNAPAAPPAVPPVLNPEAGVE